MGIAFRILVSLCLCLGGPALAEEPAKPVDAPAQAETNKADPQKSETTKPEPTKPDSADRGGKTPDAGKPPTKEKRTLESFGAQNQTCEEWTDTCAVCTRVAAGATACSLPGIACQPATITCRREAPAKPPEKSADPPHEKTPPAETPPAK